MHVENIASNPWRKADTKVKMEKPRNMEVSAPNTINVKLNTKKQNTNIPRWLWYRRRGEPGLLI